MNNDDLSKFRSSIIAEFRNAPNDAWFTQATVAVIQSRSIASVVRDRIFGKGVPFVKYGRSIRYSKSSILDWLKKQHNSSIMQYESKIKEENYDSK